MAASTKRPDLRITEEFLSMRTHPSGRVSYGKADA
jgi:hypothetical protein